MLASNCHILHSMIFLALDMLEVQDIRRASGAFFPYPCLVISALLDQTPPMST